MRNLPASVKARWWAGWRGPPCWQAQDGWPQRLWTKVRVAARTGPLGAICLRRLLIMRWMTVDWLGTCIATPVDHWYIVIIQGKARKTMGAKKKLPTEASRSHKLSQN